MTNIFLQNGQPRVFQLRAPSHHEAEEWVLAIKNNLSRYKQQRRNRFHADQSGMHDSTHDSISPAGSLRSPAGSLRSSDAVSVSDASARDTGSPVRFQSPLLLGKDESAGDSTQDFPLQRMGQRYCCITRHPAKWERPPMTMARGAQDSGGKLPAALQRRVRSCFVPGCILPCPSAWN
jgi:hypothetical protein